MRLYTCVSMTNITQKFLLSLQILNRRKSSNPYITRGRLQFRLLQILLNAVALLIIAGLLKINSRFCAEKWFLEIFCILFSPYNWQKGGLAAYFKAYPTVKFVNKTIITQQRYPLDEPKENSIIVLGTSWQASGIFFADWINL